MARAKKPVKEGPAPPPPLGPDVPPKVLGVKDHIQKAHPMNDAPKMVQDVMQRQIKAINEIRPAGFSGLEKRLETAEKSKADGNTALAEGSYDKALKEYLIGIWLLMRGDPEATAALVAPTVTEADGLKALGAGSEELTDEDCFGDSSVARVEDLRRALHLNVAASALKSSKFSLAKAASQVVLGAQPENPKALFRLAKAHEGLEDVSAAIAALTSLLKIDGQSSNVEARKLLQSLRASKPKEAKMYKGFLDRAQEDGTALYHDQRYEQKWHEKARDGTVPGDMDGDIIDDILKHRMFRLAENMQTELKTMSEAGASAADFAKAYRGFLQDTFREMIEEMNSQEKEAGAPFLETTNDRLEKCIDGVKQVFKRRQEDDEKNEKFFQEECAKRGLHRVDPSQVANIPDHVKQECAEGPEPELEEGKDFFIETIEGGKS